MIEVNKIYCGKMEDVLKDFPDNYCDSIVTDSPYGLRFMNKHWDYDVPSIYQWEQAIRVLKPGGFLLSFGGTRTYHRMVVNIEDAGFEIRDLIQWNYGSGFPKSLDISKAIDAKLGVEREVTKEGQTKAAEFSGKFDQAASNERERRDNPITDEAKQWEGWGTALKPANEPICVARKPISESTVAENVLKWGTGGINIDGCRIESSDDRSARYNGKPSKGGNGNVNYAGEMNEVWDAPNGRFPANIILDEFMAEELDKQSGILTSGAITKPYEYTNNGYSLGAPTGSTKQIHDSNEGGASRFFYVAKPSQFERSKGLTKFQIKQTVGGGGGIGDYLEDIDAASGKYGSEKVPQKNFHPTVKPIELMRYLVKLVTKKGGICLDPFCGSGTTLIGCKLELINYIGIDKDAEHIPLAEARVAAWNPEKYLPQTLF